MASDRDGPTARVDGDAGSPAVRRGTAAGGGADGAAEATGAGRGALRPVGGKQGLGAGPGRTQPFTNRVLVFHTDAGTPPVMEHTAAPEGVPEGEPRVMG